MNLNKLRYMPPLFAIIAIAAIPILLTGYLGGFMDANIESPYTVRLALGIVIVISSLGLSIHAGEYYKIKGISLGPTDPMNTLVTGIEIAIVALSLFGIIGGLHYKLTTIFLMIAHAYFGF